jgi:hydrogenase nickel incorporation protein HypA/HybF
MHELSIAQRLVEQIEDELAVRADAAMRGGEPPLCGKIGRVVVRVGALSGVLPAALASAFPSAAAASTIGDAILEIEECPAILWCDGCGKEQTLLAAGRMRCPQCGVLSRKLVSGRQLELTSIEVFNVPSGPDDASHPRSANADPEEK